MKIETKYDIGQEVWMLVDITPTLVKVEGIEIEQDDDRIVIFYFLSIWDDCKTSSREDLLFPTKEELLKSLSL